MPDIYPEIPLDRRYGPKVRELLLDSLPPPINKLMRGDFRVSNRLKQDWHAQMAIASIGLDLDKMEGLVRVTIEIVDRKADIDARIKPILDGLQEIGVLENDRQIRELRVLNAPFLDGEAVLRICWEPIAEVYPVPAPKRRKTEA